MLQASAKTEHARFCSSIVHAQPYVCTCVLCLYVKQQCNDLLVQVCVCTVTACAPKMPLQSLNWANNWHLLSVSLSTFTFPLALWHPSCIKCILLLVLFLLILTSHFWSWPTAESEQNSKYSNVSFGRI